MQIKTYSPGASLAFQKMSFKLATHIFRKLVSAGIKTCVNKDQLKSLFALNTSKFVDIMNDMFETCKYVLIKTYMMSTLIEGL